MTVTAEMKEEVRGWVIESLETLGYPDLLEKLEILWNERFTARMGDARYNYSTGQCRVRFSVPLWPRASQEERRQTAIHEVCHIVAGHRAHTVGLRRPQPHGHEWQALMRRCGLEPKRTHKVNRDGLRRRTRTVTLDCLCDGGVQASEYVAGRLAAGAKYSCKRCKAPLKAPLGALPCKPRRKSRRRKR